MEKLTSATGPYRGHTVATLPAEDDELTHVARQTPCGEYMRWFWLPVAMSSQLGEHPVAIRILGEDLVVFRDRGALLWSAQPSDNGASSRRMYSMRSSPPYASPAK